MLASVFRKFKLLDSNTNICTKDLHFKFKNNNKNKEKVRTSLSLVETFCLNVVIYSSIDCYFFNVIS